MQSFRMFLSHLISTVRLCMIHTCYAMLWPYRSSKATAQHCRRETAVLCCGLEKNGMVGAWHEHGMASVNQTRPHCLNIMGKTHSKPLAARHGRVTAWARQGNGKICVNRPLRWRQRPHGLRNLGNLSTSQHGLTSQKTCIFKWHLAKPIG